MDPRYGRYFASGSNHAGEIAGCRAIGLNVGVAAIEVMGGKPGSAKARAVAELKAYKGTGLMVFVDSGAFAEVDRNLEIVEPILHDGPKGWTTRLDLYDELATELGGALYCVAPDRVGSQSETLARLTTYAWRMRKLRAKGAKIIVPLQKGEMSAANFATKVAEALGFSDFVYGVPLCKAATSRSEMVALAAALPAGTKVHLLGKGPRSKATEDAVSFDECASAFAHCEMTCDAVRITALVGRSNGPGGGPRALTAAADRWRARHGSDAYRVKRDSVIEVLGAEVGADVVAALAAAA